MKIIIHGLGRMGMQIARKLAESNNHTVFAFNRSQEPLEIAAQYGITALKSPNDFKEAFGSERPIVWVMLPAEITDKIILEWAKILPAGAIIINGGNSDFRQTQVLNQELTQFKIDFVDIGVSGGIWGYDRGFPLMCGTDNPETFATLVPVLETLSRPGGKYYHFGPSGAGHYVKMIHNAIEYGMMQSIGEGIRLLKDGPYHDINLAAAADLWQHNSVITSWLMDLTREALSENPNLDGVSGVVAENGEARWAAEVASEYNIEIPAITSALSVRQRSQEGVQNFATKVVAAQRHKFGGHDLNGMSQANLSPPEKDRTV